MLVLSRDGVVEAALGGAPARWTGRRLEACDALPEAVLQAGRALVRDVAQRVDRAPARRARVPPASAGAPSFTLLLIEAIMLRPCEVDADPLVRRALDPLRGQAEAARVSLRIEADPELPAIWVDPPKIAWVVTALVGNALRYVRRGGATMPGGNVVVRLSHAAGRPMFGLTVEDDGPGMPPGVQSRLLASSAEGDATGVSLRLVHEVVCAHGGGMVIKSSAAREDCGTTVTVWLPICG
jgi:signal transduction histidine kinase